MTDFEEPSIEPVIDDRTPNFGWPMVHKANNARETDTHRLRSFAHSVDAELASAALYTTSAKSGDYTVVADDKGKVIVVTSATAATITLPTVASVPQGFHVKVMSLGAGRITVEPQGASTIQGEAALDLSEDQSVTLWSDGTNWYNGALGTPRLLTVVPLIDKNFLFAAEYGAHGDDYVSASDMGSDKSAAVIEAVERSINSGRVCVMPEGKMRMDSAVDWQEADHLRLRIAGAGDEASQLCINGDVNSRGALRFNMTNRSKWCNLRVSDLAIQACSPTQTTVRNCGTAVQLRRSDPPGLRQHREATFERVFIGSQDNFEGYFERQFDLEGLWNGIIKDSRASQLPTAINHDSANAYRNSWLPYKPESALHVRGCYGFVAMDTIFRCGGGNVVDGVTVPAGAPIIFDTSGLAEGGLFIRCVSNFGKTGVLIRGTANEPAFQFVQ